MELEFQKSTVQYLKTALRDVQNQELTQELRLPEDMPDIGRVLGGWGQVIFRSKEWRSDSIAFSGGVLVWILYSPENGSSPQWVESWIPFQMKWDMDSGIRDGDIRIQCLLRFVDARSVSARKIMLRCGVGALAEAFVEEESRYAIPGEVPADVQLLRGEYPVRLPKEAGEKAFGLDEELDPLPAGEKVCCYTMEPRISECKVMNGKIVFRGNGMLHILTSGENGKLRSRDFQVPFSQYTDLKGSHSGDAQAEIRMGVTSLELDREESGSLRLKCGLLAQYVLDDREILPLVEDAYSTGRAVELQKEELMLPAILESRQVTVPMTAEVRQDAQDIADVSFLPDFPRSHRGEEVSFELPGQFQVLYYGPDGTLQSAMPRAEGQWQMIADESSQVNPTVLPGSGITSVAGSGISLETGPVLHLNTVSTRGIPMVTGLKLTDREPEQNRPSLILRRTGNAGLWDIAKSTGSTVEAIRKANGLETEPVKDQILLIPVR